MLRCVPFKKALTALFLLSKECKTAQDDTPSVLLLTSNQTRKKKRAMRPVFLSLDAMLKDSTQSKAFSSLAISDGLRVTVKPQASMIASLASAVSAPPEINAPA